MVKNVIRIKIGIRKSVRVSVKIWKTWNPATCSCENDKYLGSIVDSSMITFDEMIEETKSTSTKSIPTNSIQKNSIIDCC